MKGRPWAYSSLAAAVAGLMIVGCSGTVGDDKPREAVSGTVTMDGQPLPEGSILFVPEGNKAGETASAAGKIANGEFSIPRAEGPLPGNYKVMISHTDDPSSGEIKLKLHDIKESKSRSRAGSKSAQSKETIPAEYNSQTTLKAEIPKGGKGDLKFDIRSK